MELVSVYTHLCYHKNIRPTTTILLRLSLAIVREREWKGQLSQRKHNNAYEKSFLDFVSFSLSFIVGFIWFTFYKTVRVCWVCQLNVSLPVYEHGGDGWMSKTQAIGQSITKSSHQVLSQQSHPFRNLPRPSTVCWATSHDGTFFPSQSSHSFHESTTFFKNTLSPFQLEWH